MGLQESQPDPNSQKDASLGSGPSTDPESGPKRSWPRRLLNRMEVDQAVFYAMSARYWQFLAGPVTLALVMRFFSPTEQGYYFTFWSVIGLQAFFEFAFPQTILTTASHQWGKLRRGERGEIVGDVDARSRLVHLFRTSVAVYAVLALVFGAFLSIGGFWFFSDSQGQDVPAWQMPWLTLVAFSAASFLFIPCLSILEGCDQVKAIYQLQLARAVLGNVVVWIGILLGYTLWLPAAAVAARLICEVVLVSWRYASFFQVFLSPPSAARLDWRGEIWPFQSRLMLKGFFNYLNSDLIVPVLFRYQNAVVAGQFGMTWSILMALRGVASAWVRTRAPKMGTLVAQRDYVELDRIFKRVSGIAIAAMITLSACVVLGLLVLPWLGTGYEVRFLGPVATAVLCVGLTASILIEFQWLYLHAHGQSPYVFVTIACCLTSGVLIWILGSVYGVPGVCLAYVVMHALVYLPLSTYAWINLRRRWHVEVAE